MIMCDAKRPSISPSLSSFMEIMNILFQQMETVISEGTFPNRNTINYIRNQYIDYIRNLESIQPFGI